jgi:hypothetical protein
MSSCQAMSRTRAALVPGDGQGEGQHRCDSPLRAVRKSEHRNDARLVVRSVPPGPMGLGTPTRLAGHRRLAKLGSAASLLPRRPSRPDGYGASRQLRLLPSLRSATGAADIGGCPATHGDWPASLAVPCRSSSASRSPTSRFRFVHEPEGRLVVDRVWIRHNLPCRGPSGREVAVRVHVPATRCGHPWGNWGPRRYALP